jgi:serine/threonine protein kinase/Tol biopolymer transport system component
MSSNHWQRLNEVFADAVEAPLTEREIRVKEACGDDDALRAEAMAMLSAADGSGDFLEASAIDMLAHEVATEGWSLRPGERVGVYRVEWLLGSGGSGEVWRAHDERLGRDVAIKMLLPHFASDADRLRRFQQEARAAGALNHPNILAVYDVGEHRGTPFLVCECLEGESLRRRLESGSLPVDETLAIASEITRGLAAAHARGIVHRDLKPDNVFLRSDGGVKILDFGLAKLRLPGVDQPGQTITGVIAGTPAYMAPEQVRGAEVDGRADLFALGAMLYEMIGGRRPFAGSSTVETLHAILAVDPPAISDLRPEVPPAVANVVHRCLEKSLDRRYQKTEEVLTALEAASVARTLSTTESLAILGESAAGTRLGKYVIVAHLDRGSRGEVYRARDTRLHRDVIIEILAGGNDRDSGECALVQREASILATLDHPNLAATYGLEAIGDFHVLAAELVEGQLLSERLTKESIGLDDAVAIAKQLAAALEALHDHGILHGSVDTSTIIVRRDGSVKLLKFGLADLPTTGDVRGSYRSPEEVRGEPIDKRADLWSFGCVLFELLTGRAAFPIDALPDSAETNKQVPDFRALPSKIPRHVGALLYRCLQVDPARRLRDAGDARLELETPIGSEWLGMPASNVPTRSSVRLAWTVAIVALLSAAGLVWAVLASSWVPTRTASTMRFISVTNLAGVESQPTLSPDGRSVAFVSNRTGRWDLYVALVSGGNLVRITDDPNVETRPQWSPDGARLVYARLNENGTTDLWNVPASGGRPRRIVVNAATPAWSHDGRSIAYRSEGAIWVSDAEGANPRAVTQPEKMIIRHTQPAFSHDGMSIVFVRQLSAQRGELVIVDLRTGTRRDLTRDGALALSPVWSPDDRFIYFTSSRGGTLSTWRISVTSGDPEPITAGQEDNEDIALSVDGRRLAFSSSRTNIGLAEMSLEPASLGRLTWLTAESARGETAPRYSPDGQRIAYFTNRNSLERDTLWVMDADGQNATRILEDGRFNIHPRWTPDGQTLLFASRADASAAELRFDLRRLPASGGVPQVLPMKPFNSTWGDVGTDGRFLYRTASREAEIYDPRTNERQPLPNVFGETWWMPDGRSFVVVAPTSNQTTGLALTPAGPRPSDAGVWIGTVDGMRKQIFSGWAVWCAVSRIGEILFLEGKPDLRGVLWRTDSRGEHRTRLTEVPLLLRHNELSTVRFDVHPDGRRIVLEARPVYESDIGVIDNVR